MDPQVRVICILAVLTVATISAQPPCNSRLRLLRPERFGHCTDCTYSQWTDWEQVSDSIGTDKSGTCASGRAYNETRRQIATGENCKDRVENQTICAPTQGERLVLLLGLGQRQLLTKRGPNPGQPLPGEIQINSQIIPTSRAAKCSEGATCRELWHNAKRSIWNEKERSVHLDLSDVNTIEVNHYDPVPFSIKDHGHRFRRDSNNCKPGDNQHVLFVLDTSGSISTDHFRQMKNAVADLVSLFCKPIEVAVLTFDNGFHLEFCFNCHGTDNRAKTMNAIRNIEHRRGPWTHTGGAARCICNTLLGQDCGVEFADKTCVDVVFITDGNSNVPRFDVCEEVKCLHEHALKLNTYSLGIGNFKSHSSRRELKCIQSSSNEFSLFEFETFDEFVREIKQVEEDLFSSTEHTCADTEGGLHTD